MATRVRRHRRIGTGPPAMALINWVQPRPVGVPVPSPTRHSAGPTYRARDLVAGAVLAATALLATVTVSMDGTLPGQQLFGGFPGALGDLVPGGRNDDSATSGPRSSDQLGQLFPDLTPALAALNRPAAPSEATSTRTQTRDAPVVGVRDAGGPGAARTAQPGGFARSSGPAIAAANASPTSPTEELVASITPDPVARTLSPVVETVAPVLDPISRLLAPAARILGPVTEPLLDTASPVLTAVLDPVIRTSAPVLEIAQPVTAGLGTLLDGLLAHEN